MLYEQNLLNSFLYKLQRPEVTSPLCHCGKDEQTSYHVVLQCENVNPDIRHQALQYVTFYGGAHHTENSIALLNASRDKNFVDRLVKIVELQKDFIRDTIELD